jgi:hypothetical protein
VKRYLVGFFLVSWFTAAFFSASFFANLRSGQVDYSGFGTTWPLQLIYNFVNDRPFQSSIFATDEAGQSVGFKESPYPYIHANVIHVNVTPYLFAPVWALWPTLDWLYGLIFLFNYAGALVFSRLILKELSPSGTRLKFFFASAVLAGSGFFMVLNQMAQFLLFAGPFMLAAYYFLIAGRRGWFFASIVALCLVTEDAAMVAMTFAAYIYFFEPERRVYARDAALFSVPYLVLVLFVVQPASRVDMVKTAGTTAEKVIVDHLFGLTPELFRKNMLSLLPALTLFPAFALAGLLFGWPRREGRRLLALAILPPLPHWAESVFAGGAHHLMPPFAFVYVALLRMLATAPGRTDPLSEPRSRWAVAGITAFFFLFAFRVSAPNLPAGLKPFLYRLLGNEEKAALRERSLRVETETNHAVIRASRAIPPDKSLVYWVNKRVPGYLIHRNDLWPFPYYFDKADYLLIQKDGLDLIYYFDPSAPGDLREAVAEGEMLQSRDAPMTERHIERVVETLVRQEGTHRVAHEDEHALVLERIEPAKLEMPTHTLGLGWVPHVLGRR